ncbi:MAG: MFS transporter [Eubacteriaceae bacterium]|jgi:predicted MFS family arabinose efflux permease|nr:MFS transporter [Eubacteriaceae bacterium]
MKKFTFKTFMIFLILSASVALAYQIPYLRYTFYDQFAAAYQLTNVQVGLTASAVSFTSTLCYPIGGIFADRFSLRSLILITLGGFTIVTVAFAMTTSFILMMIIHVLFGFFGIATLWSAYLNGIRNLADEDNQSKIFGSSEATRGIIQTIVGFAFLGILGVASTPADGFKYGLLFSAAVCGIFFVLAFIYLPKENPKAPDSDEASDVQYTFGDIIKNKGVWITIMVLMCAYLSWTIGNNYMTTYTVQVLQISQNTASMLGIIRSYIIVLLAGFIGGIVLDKFTYKGKGFILFFILVVAVTVALTASSSMVGLSIVLTLVIAFIANVMKSTYWSIMDQAGIPLGMTALATGVISFIIFVPDFLIGPIFGKWLDDAAAAGNIANGFNRIFIFLIVASIVGVISAYLLLRRTKELENQKNTPQSIPEP